MVWVAIKIAFLCKKVLWSATKNKPGGLQRTEPKISVKIPHNLKSCSCMSYGVLLPTGSCLSDLPIKLKKNKKTRKANSLLLHSHSVG